MNLDPAHLARVLQHEAAHVVAGIHLGATIISVAVFNPRSTHPRRRGVYGEAEICCILPDHDAFVQMAGYAWEVAERPAECEVTASGDLREARRFAAEAGQSIEAVAERAHQFVRDFGHAIRACAEDMQARMPKSGLLSGRALERALERARELVPKGFQWRGRGQGLTSSPYVPQAVSARTGKDAPDP